MGFNNLGCNLTQRADIPTSLGLSSWYLANQCWLALEPIWQGEISSRPSTEQRCWAQGWVRAKTPCWGVGFSTNLQCGACVSWFGAKAEHTDVCLQNILLGWKLLKAWCSLSSLPSGQKWHKLLIFAGTKLYQILFSQCWSWKGTWFQPGGYCAHFCSCFLLACNPSKIKTPASGELTWTHPILLSKCPMSALYRSIYKCAYESRQFVLRFTKNMSNSPCILTGHSNYFQKSIMCTIILFSAQGGFFFPASQVTVYFYRINCYKLS